VSGSRLALHFAPHDCIASPRRGHGPGGRSMRRLPVPRSRGHRAGARTRASGRVTQAAPMMTNSVPARTAARRPAAREFARPAITLRLCMCQRCGQSRSASFLSSMIFLQGLCGRCPGRPLMKGSWDVASRIGLRGMRAFGRLRHPFRCRLRVDLDQISLQIDWAVRQRSRRSDHTAARISGSLRHAAQSVCGTSPGSAGKRPRVLTSSVITDMRQLS